MDLSAGRKNSSKQGSDFDFESNEKICQIEMQQNLSLTWIKVWAKKISGNNNASIRFLTEDR